MSRVGPQGHQVPARTPDRSQTRSRVRDRSGVAGTCEQVSSERPLRTGRLPGATARGAGRDVPCRALRSVGWERSPASVRGSPTGLLGVLGGLRPALRSVPGRGAVPGPRWPVAGRGRSRGRSQHLQEALAGRGGATAWSPSFKDGHLAWETEVTVSLPSLGIESQVGESRLGGV